MSTGSRTSGNGSTDFTVVSRLINGGENKRVHAIVEGAAVRYEPSEFPRLVSGDELVVNLKGTGARLTIPSSMDGFEVVRVRGAGVLDIGGRDVRVNRLERSDDVRLLLQGKPASLKGNGRLRV